ncbi:hypothetical protein ACFJIW_11235 [Tahibacter sp. UC22_41]|uniref:hypothetical protein n=1 Tax=Tahibacter sp. UC22_41 TaxID=3350178 RepID=UPI0036D9C3BA
MNHSYSPSLRRRRDGAVPSAVPAPPGMSSTSAAQRRRGGPALCAMLGLLLAPAVPAAILVTDTGTSSAGTCTLAQAIAAANLANNPGNATPAGATTIDPLSGSAAMTVGIGTCAGAAVGANLIQLPPGATITLDAASPDNFWYGPNALPPIASTIAIEGNGALLRIPFVPATRLRFFSSAPTRCAVRRRATTRRGRATSRCAT